MLIVFSGKVKVSLNQCKLYTKSKLGRAKADRLVFLLVLKSGCLLKTKYCQTKTSHLSK